MPHPHPSPTPVPSSSPVGPRLLPHTCGQCAQPRLALAGLWPVTPVAGAAGRSSQRINTSHWQPVAAPPATSVVVPVRKSRARVRGAHPAERPRGVHPRRGRLGRGSPVIQQFGWLNLAAAGASRSCWVRVEHSARMHACAPTHTHTLTHTRPPPASPPSGTSAATTAPGAAASPAAPPSVPACAPRVPRRCRSHC